MDFAFTISILLSLSRVINKKAPYADSSRATPTAPPDTWETQVYPACQIRFAPSILYASKVLASVSLITYTDFAQTTLQDAAISDSKLTIACLREVICVSP